MIRKVKNIKGQWVYQDPERERSYRRIVGGLGWPQPGQPGFLVVVGEAWSRDEGLRARPLVVLQEREAASIEALHRGCRELRRLTHGELWLADLGQQGPVELWRRQNRELEEGYRVYLSQAPYSQEEARLLTLYQMLAEVTSRDRKILSFGDNSLLPAKLLALGPEEQNQPAYKFPAAAALGYVVAEMLLGAPPEGNLNIRVICDWDPMTMEAR